MSRASETAHSIEVTSSFLVDGWTCECSCGWISDSYEDADAALYYGQEHQREVGRGN